MISREQFIQILIRLNPQNEAMFGGAGASLPMITQLTAAHCFVHQKDMWPQRLEDEAHLREQCLNLEENSCFDFEGD